MADSMKTKFYEVKSNIEETASKPRFSIWKKWKRILIIIGILFLVIGGIYLSFVFRQYDSYEVESSVERNDTAGTQYAEYANGILRYSNDGASYTDLDDELKWTQTYEMDQPTISICQNVVAIADIGGSDIYIMNKSGLMGNIESTEPILMIDVAKQGTIAVLSQGEKAFSLTLYDAEGSVLAAGEIYADSYGYPLALSLAPNATKLAISSVLPSQGTVSTHLVFYNFGSVGQNSEDNIVGEYTYEDTILADLEYVANDKCIAFGDAAVQIYTGSQKPQLGVTVELEEEIKSIFYSEKYFGIVTDNNDEENTRHFTVYDLKGKIAVEKDFDMDYEEIEFLSNGEICIRAEKECQIFSMYGVEKFDYDFDVELYCVIPEYFGMYYTFVQDGIIERVRLQ